MAATATPRVVVLGGGFGGLEAAFYLRMRLGERVRLILVSAEDHFLYKPNTIYIPFGMDPDRLKIPLARPTRRKDITFLQAHAREIDPQAKTVVADGATLPYDFLVVGPVPG